MALAIVGTSILEVVGEDLIRFIEEELAMKLVLKQQHTDARCGWIRDGELEGREASWVQIRDRAVSNVPV
jgi:hypothetical protein